MGYYSDLDIEFRESNKNPYIADVLGISYENLLSLDYEFYTDKGKNGLIYIFRIKFSQSSPSEILKKIDRLEEDGCTVYIQPWELNVKDYYQYEYESISSSNHYLSKFQTEMDNLKELSQFEIQSKKLTGVLHRQICIGVIATMETFLSEVFINSTMNNKTYFQNFIKYHPEFKQRKFELRDIFEEHSNLKETAKKVMMDTIYHNLPSVSQMFRTTFKVNFPNISDVYQYVLMRHDLVHRNGLTKEGATIETNEKVIDELITCVTNFIHHLSEELNLS